jgi:hypothetical protein
VDGLVHIFIPFISEEFLDFNLKRQLYFLSVVELSDQTKEPTKLAPLAYPFILDSDLLEDVQKIPHDEREGGDTEKQDE